MSHNGHGCGRAVSVTAAARRLTMRLYTAGGERRNPRDTPQTALRRTQEWRGKVRLQLGSSTCQLAQTQVLVILLALRFPHLPASHQSNERLRHINVYAWPELNDRGVVGVERAAGDLLLHEMRKRVGAFCSSWLSSSWCAIMLVHQILPQALHPFLRSLLQRKDIVVSCIA